MRSFFALVVISLAFGPVGCLNVTTTATVDRNSTIGFVPTSTIDSTSTRAQSSSISTSSTNSAASSWQLEQLKVLNLTASINVGKVVMRDSLMAVQVETASTHRIDFYTVQSTTIGPSTVASISFDASVNQILDFVLYSTQGFDSSVSGTVIPFHCFLLSRAISSGNKLLWVYQSRSSSGPAITMSLSSTSTTSATRLVVDEYYNYLYALGGPSFYKFDLLPAPSSASSIVVSSPALSSSLGLFSSLSAGNLTVNLITANASSTSTTPTSSTVSSPSPAVAIGDVIIPRLVATNTTMEIFNVTDVSLSSPLQYALFRNKIYYVQPDHNSRSVYVLDVSRSNEIRGSRIDVGRIGFALDNLDDEILLLQAIDVAGSLVAHRILDPDISVSVFSSFPSIDHPITGEESNILYINDTLVQVYNSRFNFYKSGVQTSFSNANVTAAVGNVLITRNYRNFLIVTSATGRVALFRIISNPDTNFNAWWPTSQYAHETFWKDPVVFIREQAQVSLISSTEISAVTLAVEAVDVISDHPSAQIVYTYLGSSISNDTSTSYIVIGSGGANGRDTAISPASVHGGQVLLVVIRSAVTRNQWPVIFRFSVANGRNSIKYFEVAVSDVSTVASSQRIATAASPTYSDEYVATFDMSSTQAGAVGTLSNLEVMFGGQTNLLIIAFLGLLSLISCCYSVLWCVRAKRESDDFEAPTKGAPMAGNAVLIQGQNIMDRDSGASRNTPQTSNRQVGGGGVPSLASPADLNWSDGDFSIMQRIKTGKCANEIFDGELGPAKSASIGATKCTVKIIKGYEMYTLAEQFAGVLQEVGLMYAHRDHPNFVKIYGYIRSPLTVVMQHCSLGGLDDYLPNVTPATSLSIAKDVTEFLTVFHAGGFCHNSLKSSNILLNGDMRGSITAMVGDFGHTTFATAETKQKNGERVSKQAISYARYSAPETLRGDKIASGMEKMQDIYSLGGIFFELLALEKVWNQANNPTELTALVIGGQRAQMPYQRQSAILSNPSLKELQNIMGFCWNQDASARPQASDIKGRLAPFR